MERKIKKSRKKITERVEGKQRNKWVLIQEKMFLRKFFLLTILCKIVLLFICCRIIKT